MSNAVDNTPNGLFDPELAAVLEVMAELNLTVSNATTSEDLDALEKKLLELDIKTQPATGETSTIGDEIAEMRKRVAAFRQDLAKIREDDAQQLQSSRNLGF